MWCFLGLALLSIAWTAHPYLLGLRVVLGQSVPVEKQIPLRRIRHAAWTRLVSRYVDDAGNVDYGAWKANTADVQALEDYLKELSRGAPELDSSRETRLAFWINAYNAVTVRGILREYPTTSIQNHVARFLGYNIWRDLLLWVGDQTYSLGQIEHAVLRPMNEPRIHFALVCASRGCPRLRNEAYLARSLEEQLDDDASTFFSSSDHCRVDSLRGTLSLSPILFWYERDFGPNRTERLTCIEKFLPVEARVVTSSWFDPPDMRIDYLDYDWSLNDKATVRKKQNVESVSEDQAPLPPGFE